MRIGLSTLGVTSPQSVVSGGGGGEPPSDNLLEHWKLNTGLTQTGGFASAWVDQIEGDILVQDTASAQPAVQADGSLLFDGIDDFMQLPQGSITLPQPCTLYIKMAHLSTVDNAGLFPSTNAFVESNVQLGEGNGGHATLYAGANVLDDPSMPTGANFFVLQAVLNGASSLLQIDNNTAVTGDAGTDGFRGYGLATFVNDGLPDTLFANIQVKEILVYYVAHDTSQRAAVKAYLAGV